MVHIKGVTRNSEISRHIKVRSLAPTKSEGLREETATEEPADRRCIRNRGKRITAKTGQQGRS